MEQPNQIPLQTVKATWGIAFKVWWWFTWRAVLVSFFSGFILGFVMGFIGALAGINSNEIVPVAAISGGALGIAINVFFIKKVLGKKFKSFKIVLLASDK